MARRQSAHQAPDGLLTAPEALVLVAAGHDGHAAGHLIGHFHGASAMWTAARTELISMYVVPGYRGRNLGSRLVEAFLRRERALRDMMAARLTLGGGPA